MISLFGLVTDWTQPALDQKIGSTNGLVLWTGPSSYLWRIRDELTAARTI